MFFLCIVLKQSKCDFIHYERLAKSEALIEAIKNINERNNLL